MIEPSGPEVHRRQLIVGWILLITCGLVSPVYVIVREGAQHSPVAGIAFRLLVNLAIYILAAALAYRLRPGRSLRQITWPIAILVVISLAVFTALLILVDTICRSLGAHGGALSMNPLVGIIVGGIYGRAVRGELVDLTGRSLLVDNANRPDTSGCREE